MGVVSITIEIKTLNGRFFEVLPKLAPGLSHLELPMVSLLQEKLVRGKVFLNVRFNESGRGFENITPSWQTIDQYISIATSIKQKYQLEQGLNLSDLVKLPNVLITQENVMTADDDTVVMGLLSKAASTVDVMRTEEGKRLERDFEKIFQSCHTKVELVERAFRASIDQQKELIHRAIAEHTQQDQPNIIADELQAGLRKMDVHEEITRFKSHLASINPVLQSTQNEKGKRLDFIMQELMRETNTMMAKCPAYSVSTTCIEIKVELEKGREQIQNIL